MKFPTLAGGIEPGDPRASLERRPRCRRTLSLVILSGVLGASAALGATIHADARKGTAAAAGADGSRQRPFRNLQEAVNAAAPGDVVEVAPGRYEGFVDVPPTAAGITIRGVGNATLEALSGAVGFCDAALDVRAPDVTVERLQIVSVGDGIDFEGPRGYAHHDVIATLTTGECTAMLDRQGGSVFEHNVAFVHAYGFYGSFQGATVRFNHLIGEGDPNTSFLTYVFGADGLVFTNNQLTGIADLGQIFGADLLVSDNHAEVTARGFALFGSGVVSGNHVTNTGAGPDIEAVGSFTFDHNQCQVGSPAEACD